MTNILQQDLMNLILDDEKRLARDVGNAMTTIEAAVDLMVDLGPYLISEMNDPTSLITPEYVARVTNKFQSALVAKMEAMTPKLMSISSLGATDPSDTPETPNPAATVALRAANLTAHCATYNCVPATFAATRYKV